MVRSPRFGSNSCYCVALFRLGFPAAPCIIHLTSQHKLTRRLILQQERCHPINRAPADCKLTVLGSISLSFSLFFSPFRHRTGSLSVTARYLAFPHGRGGFRQGFTCPALLGNSSRGLLISITGLSPSMVYLSKYVHLLKNFVTLSTFGKMF